MAWPSSSSRARTSSATACSSWSTATWTFRLLIQDAHAGGNLGDTSRQARREPRQGSGAERLTLDHGRVERQACCVQSATPASWRGSNGATAACTSPSRSACRRARSIGPASRRARRCRPAYGPCTCPAARCSTSAVSTTANDGLPRSSSSALASSARVARAASRPSTGTGRACGSQTAIVSHAAEREQRRTPVGAGHQHGRHVGVLVALGRHLAEQRDDRHEHPRLPQRLRAPRCRRRERRRASGSVRPSSSGNCGAARSRSWLMPPARAGRPSPRGRTGRRSAGSRTG